MVDLARKLAAIVFSAAALSGCGGSSVPAVRSVPPPDSPLRPDLKTQGCISPPCIYVANSSKLFHRGSITVYRYGANGNVSPVERIAGTKTGLQNPSGVALDSSRNIYVSNFFGEYGGSVTEYAAGSNGNVSPVRTIDNAPSGRYLMVGVADVVIDSAGYIFVPANDSNSVSVYAPDANGDAPPARYIQGGKTEMHDASYVAVTKDGTIYVPNYLGDSVTIFGRRADGNVAPIRMIAGSQTKLRGCSGLGIDSKGNIYVSNYNTNSVAVFDKHANGNVAPIAIIAGSATGINGPDSMTVDAKDNVYVSNTGAQNGGSVTVYAKGATGNVAPIATITGSKTMIDAPAGLVVQ